MICPDDNYEMVLLERKKIAPDASGSSQHYGYIVYIYQCPKCNIKVNISGTWTN
jgi:hypothetical protein